MPYVVTALGSGGIGLIIKAIMDRRSVNAKANLDDTSAAVALTTAATGLLEPLRQQIADERKEHAKAREADRAEVAELHMELEACKREAHELRKELAMARVEADELRRAREQDRAKIRVLESMLRRKS